MPKPAAVLETACAKVNLTLRVLGRRPNGYHELQSLVAFARSGGDVVELVSGGEPTVTVSGPFADKLKGENLLSATLELIAEAASHLQLGSVHLHKNLPVAAGIGGGSADAAALLRAVRAANGAVADGVDWMCLAARLGADVPVCLVNRAASVSGVGEDVEPLPGLPRLAVVLVNALTEMPADKTARVFKSLAAPALAGAPERKNLPQLATADALVAYMAETGNDLTPAAIEIAPEIGEVIGVLEASPGVRYRALSGAGPTCFGVYDDLEAAEAAAAAIRAARPHWWVLASVLE